ncbi:unnamed protein product [Brachionus calyciflorus]|uniref:TRPM SLOG domain-containing protein n=1 Tax=Brachionus calyciflorus TaxID=104777 RepID=A0A814JDW7_9BILA|nr:unnamed protein product [Brachionus calyciflorus]
MNKLNCINDSQIVYDGKIRFPSLNNKTASIIGVKNDIKPHRILSHMFSRFKWNLSKPKLILSVIGGPRNFKMANSMKKAFKRGLIKASVSTDSWIITDGYSSGVSKLVGEAISENSHNTQVSNLVVIGISNSENVVYKEQLQELKTLDKSFSYDHQDVTKTCNDNYLDSNHTHFILFYGENTKNGNKLRGCLESELRKSETNLNISKKSNDFNLDKSVPMIQICVHGDFDTLCSIRQSLESRVPILVLAGSKGCADLIANALNQIEPNIPELVIESKILDRKIQFYDKMLHDACDCLKTILSFKDLDLINIFRLEDEEDSQDIESAILRAFLDSQKGKHFDNLRLATQWNRIDIAKNNILIGEEEFTSDQLSKLLEIALIDNKPEFVQLFLENGANLNNFLTNGRLYYLYNSESIHEEFKRTPIFYVFRDIFGLKNSNFFISFKKLRTFFKQYIFEDSDFKFFPFDIDLLFETNTDEQQQQLKNHLDETFSKDNKDDLGMSGFDQKWLNKSVEKNLELNLFIWALVFKRIDIAKIFWRIGEYQMANALIAATLYENLSLKLQNNIELKNISNDFLEMALGVLHSLEISSKEDVNFEYLEQNISHYGLDCLKIAVLGNQKKFVASSCVQNLLNEKWYGCVVPNDGIDTLLKVFYILIVW